MLDFIKKNIFICVIFIITLSIGFLTFLTFINKSFIELNQTNLQTLLGLNIVLLLIFFVLIFLEIKNALRSNINVNGSKANKKYIHASIYTYVLIYLLINLSIYLYLSDI